MMKSFNYCLLALLLTCAQCRHIGTAEKSFDQISAMVNGRTADEVEALLGPPNTRQPVLFGDERWIWWNYTYLDGKDYAPQVRGRVVHLEILFKNPTPPGKRRLPYSQWHIVSPYGVSYSGFPPERMTVPAKQTSADGVSPVRLLKGDPRHDSARRPPQVGPAHRHQPAIPTSPRAGSSAAVSTISR